VTVRNAIRTHAAALAIVVVCSAITARAAAEPNDAQAKARAQGLLSEGTAAYGRGDYAAALDKFTAAYKIFPSPKLWFNIGQANRDLGRPVEAVEAFDRFLRDAGDAPPETLAEARRSAAELKTKLSQIQVNCAIDGTEITVDGKQVGSTPLGEMLWTTPGRHQVAAQHEGYAPAIEDVVVTIGKIAAVNIEVLPIDLRPANTTADGAIVGAGGAAATDQGAATKPPLYRRTWFWVAAAVVIAAGAGAAVIIASSGGGSGGDASGVPATTLGAQRAF
jgi:tetratricopeptide (TPR) repeat protein